MSSTKVSLTWILLYNFGESESFASKLRVRSKKKEDIRFKYPQLLESSFKVEKRERKN